MLSRPIRRLLFRHCYGDDTAQRQAHVNAERFYDTWAERLSGTDRGVALVERLWHLANALLPARPDDFPDVLLARAGDLARAFARPEGYSPAEFAEFVLSRLWHDQGSPHSSRPVTGSLMLCRKRCMSTSFSSHSRRGRSPTAGGGPEACGVSACGTSAT